MANPKPLNEQQICRALLSAASQRAQKRQIKLLASDEALRLWMQADHNRLMREAREENAILRILLKAAGAKPKIVLKAA